MMKMMKVVMAIKMKMRNGERHVPQPCYCKRPQNQNPIAWLGNSLMEDEDEDQDGDEDDDGDEGEGEDESEDRDGDDEDRHEDVGEDEDPV